MPSDQHLVLPRLPTALSNDTHVELPGYDSWLLHLDNVHVIPTKLDATKFEDALSRVLQLYPHAAGQLRCTDGCWSIELTNTAVPVDIDYRPNMSSDSFLVGNWVIQDELSPLLNQQPVDANVVNGNAPLLRFKLTVFDDETCIGVTWNHSLGDAIMVSRLMNILSQFYQDLPLGVPAPTFEKHRFPTPSATLSSPLHPTRHFDPVAYVESCKDLQHVRWRVDCQDLEELHSKLKSGLRGRKYLSKHDCLIAYFITVISYCRRSPVRNVVNVCSYRHVDAPFVAENVAGNLILIIRAGIPKGMAGIASAIRDAIVQSREPDHLYVLETLKSAHMLEAANAGSPLPFSCDDDELLVNSNVAIDWRSADFGCPDGVRFYTHGAFMDVVRCFKSNPVKEDDGVWRARQSIEVGVGVSSRVKPKMMRTLGRGIRYMLRRERRARPTVVMALHRPLGDSAKQH